MKAEQRKELETNTLADKMGHVMQRVKASPRRTFVIYFVVAAVAVFGAWFVWNWYRGEKVAASEQWIMLYDGGGNAINQLATKEKDTPAGKAARLQIGWNAYWDEGVKMLGSDKAGAMKRLEAVAEFYGDLAGDCKDDPVFEPQALLGRAVATESQAVQDRAHLKKAKEYYADLVTKYEKSGEADFARKRLAILKDDAKYRALENDYKVLQDLLGIPPPMPKGAFKDFDGIPGLKDKLQPN